MFSKAPVRRFNEFSSSTPPPGAYDPKFETDLSVSAACKRETSSKTSFPRIASGSSLLTPKDSKKEIFRSRPCSPTSSYFRLRSASFQRSNGSISSETSRRNTSQPPTRRLYRVPAFLPVESQDFSSQTISEDLVSPLMTESKTCSQNEEKDEKLERLQSKLDDQTEKTRALEELRQTYESMITNLKSESAKHELAKTEWEAREKSYTETIQMLQNSNIEFQQLVVSFQSTVIPSSKENESLKEQLLNLEAKIAELSAKDKQNKETMIKLNSVVQSQQELLTDSAHKCQVLVDNMNKCYEICEDKVAQIEAEKNDWKKQAVDLPRKISLMQKEIDELHSSFDAEKGIREKIEKELREATKIYSTRSTESDDKITELQSAWTVKEAKYLKMILQKEEAIKTMESNSNAFYSQADAMLTEINETNRLKEILQAAITPCLLSSDEPIKKRVVTEIEESDSYQIPESILPTNKIDSSPGSDEIAPTASEPENESSMDLGDPKDLMELEETTIPKDMNSTGEKELKNKEMQLEITLKYNKMSPQTNERRTLALIEAVEKDNQILKQQISAVVLNSDSDPSYEISPSGNNNSLVATGIEKQDDFISRVKVIKGETSFPEGNDKSERIVLVNEADEKDAEMLLLCEKSGNYLDTSPRFGSSCDTLSPSKRSPRSATPGSSRPLSNRSRHHNHNRRRCPAQSGVSVNLSTIYLDDVPEEDGN